MKKIYNFLEKSELPKFILPVKISWLIFSAVSGMEMKERSEKSHFLLILCLWLHRMCLSSCSNMNLLAGYLIFAALNSNSQLSSLDSSPGREHYVLGQDTLL